MTVTRNYTKVIYTLRRFADTPILAYLTSDSLSHCRAVEA